MLYDKKIFLLIIIVIFPFFLYAHEIQMKNGKIYKVDNYLEKEDEIIIEKFGTTLYLDKQNIEKIINQKDEKEEKEEIRKLEAKYNQAESVLSLKDGRKIKAQKTWFKDGYIFCKTEDEVFRFTQDQISKITNTSLSIPIRRIESQSYQNYNIQGDPFKKKQDYLDGPCSCCKGTGVEPISYARVGPRPKCFCCNGSGRRLEMRWK